MALDPIRPTDDDARALAHGILADARHAALAVLHPATGQPHVSRIAIGRTPEGQPMTLISALALHTAALRANPAASLLLGDPPAKGDPLAFARLTLTATARFVDRAAPGHAALRAHYLASHPKSKLYADFADFSFVTFEVTEAALNGGFGKAYNLTPVDLM